MSADGMSRIEGSDAITALFESTTRCLDDGTPRTHHVITNPIVRFELVEGAWTFSSRHMGVSLTGQLDQHLFFDPADASIT